MTLLSFQKAGIKGLAACVPKNVIRNYDLAKGIGIDDISESIKATGILERRFADNNTCASDLCYEAAEVLLSDMKIKRDSIDMVIFASHTPDYREPSTSTILQARLGLSKSTAAFDISVACSGYVYGLSTAFSYAAHKELDRVLLLVGDTLSKTISLKDKATNLLFGDAGTATLIEKNPDCKESFFSLNSDGSGFSTLIIPGGGFRTPSSHETIKEKKYEDGSIRTDEQLRMDGVDVFNFAMREIPSDIKKIAEYSKIPLENVDFIIFHQANKFMTDFFAKKLKYPKEKVPYSIQRFGNTSSASIPLTLVSELKEILVTQKSRTILSGFGSGLSWGTASLELGNCHVSHLLEL